MKIILLTYGTTVSRNTFFGAVGYNQTDNNRQGRKNTYIQDIYTNLQKNTDIQDKGKQCEYYSVKTEQTS